MGRARRDRDGEASRATWRIAYRRNLGRRRRWLPSRYPGLDNRRRLPRSPYYGSGPFGRGWANSGEARAASFHKVSYATSGCRSPIEMSPLSPIEMSPGHAVVGDVRGDERWR